MDQIIENQFNELASQFSQNLGSQIETKPKNSVQLDHINPLRIEIVKKRVTFSPPRISRRNDVVNDEKVKEIQNLAQTDQWSPYLKSLGDVEEKLQNDVKKEFQIANFFRIKHQHKSNSPKNQTTAVKTIKGDKNLNILYRVARQESQISTQIVQQIHSQIEAYKTDIEILNDSNKAIILNDLMRMLSQIDIKYSDYILFLLQEYKKLIICEDEKLKLSVGSMQFIRTMQISYKDVAFVIGSRHQDYKASTDKRIQQLKSDNEALTDQLQTALKEIDKLNALVHKNLMEYKTTLAQIEAKYEKRIKELELLKFDQEAKINELIQALQLINSKNQQELQDMRHTNAELLESMRKRLFQQIQQQEKKEEEVAQLQKLVSDYKQQFITALFSLKNANENYQHQSQQLQILDNEKSQLAVRAAISFAELTPRPDLKPLFAVLGENVPLACKSTQVIKQTLRLLVQQQIKFLCDKIVRPIEVKHKSIKR